MKHPKAKRLVALLLAMTLTVAACSSAEDESADVESAQVASAEAGAGGDDSTDVSPDHGGQSDRDLAAGSAGETNSPESNAEAGASTAGESQVAAPTADDSLGSPEESAGNTFRDYGVRPFVDTDVDPLSTFSLDVDTASYSVAKQWLSQGVVPPSESVRLEEFVNSFDYDYPAPNDGLVVVADGGPSPFNPESVILRLGVQAEQVSDSDRPAASLTFVVDTSGSMDRDDRISLVKTAMNRLVGELGPRDQVAIVTFGSRANLVLPPTSVGSEGEILDAIASLRTGGSTDVEAGLQLGYEQAGESFEDGAINRVILLSDGVANVGLTDPGRLVSMIRDDADRGIQLVSVGVGMGNFNDVLLETLADDGDGFYAYVNEQAEAERLFSDDLVSTLLTVAMDGKIQVEFDERFVAKYRLLGFENRAVLDDDFRNNDVDAGELGAGHQVTALYELELRQSVDATDRLGTAALRWENPETGELIETRLEVTGGQIASSWDDTAEDFRLAVTVAAFAEIMRQSAFADDLSLEQVALEAENLAGRSSEVRSLAELIRMADGLM